MTNDFSNESNIVQIRIESKEKSKREAREHYEQREKMIEIDEILLVYPSILKSNSK